MSVQFGRWNFDGECVPAAYISDVESVIAPYGPDGRGCYDEPGLSILFRAFHTTREAQLEQQPLRTKSGFSLTWDGRLDNREDLANQLSEPLSDGRTDVSLVAAAFDRWGVQSFPKLLGDWALSVWDPFARTLILAKDFLGSRHLYYFCDDRHVIWSSLLDPIILLAQQHFELSGEYLAGWLSFFPQLI